MGQSPHLIPPLISDSDLSNHQSTVNTSMLSFIMQLQEDVVEAKDHLVQVKVDNAFHSNKHCNPDDVFEIGDHVMLSTSHQ